MRPSRTVNLLLCEMRAIVTKNHGLTAVKIFLRWGGGLFPLTYKNFKRAHIEILLIIVVVKLTIKFQETSLCLCHNKANLKSSEIFFREMEVIK